MLQTCPKHLSKSPCELCFSRLFLPESHAQCIFIQIGTLDTQVKFEQKGCILKTVVEKGVCIRGPIRGLYEVNTSSLSRSLPWAEARLLQARDPSHIRGWKVTSSPRSYKMLQDGDFPWLCSSTIPVGIQNCRILQCSSYIPSVNLT